MHLNKPIGSNIISFESLDSTNAYAMQLANDGNADHGTTIISQFQTKGKGQQGKNWHAAQGQNLLFSFVLDTSKHPIQSQFKLNAACCSAVAHLLMEDYQLHNTGIKWPNDLYVAKKKIAGILIENVIRGNVWQFAIVGIGLNVNQTTFPEELNATSLKLCMQDELLIAEVQQKLFSQLNKAYAHFIRKDLDLLAEYNSLLLGYQSTIEYKMGERKNQGRLLGADANGFLKIGDTQYRHGEIQLIL